MRTRMARHLDALSALSREAPDQHLQRAATLVGRAATPVDLPPEFSWHDYVIFLLSTAAEIEHSLMVQYLYAAYSLGGPQVPSNSRKDVLDWQRIILGVAKEEMGHLVTVQNVLKLLGGPLHLDREDYPWASGFYPFEFTLEVLSRNRLQNMSSRKALSNGRTTCRTRNARPSKTWHAKMPSRRLRASAPCTSA